MLNHISLFFVAVALGLIGVFLGWDYWIVVTLIICLAVLNISYFLYISFASKNIKTIEKWLYKNKKDPMFGYLLALKDYDANKVIENLNKLKQKYRTPTYVHSYEYIIAFIQKDYEKAREHALAIQDKPIGKYNLAMLETCLGEGEKYLQSEFQKPWMSEAIKSVYYFMIGDQSLYEKHKQLVLDNSKGIQYASNTYTLQWNEKQFQFGTLTKEE